MITEKLFTYAVGRHVEHRDMPAVRAIVRDAADNDYRFEDLILGVINSDAFRRRAPPPELPASTTAKATNIINNNVSPVP